MTKQRSRLLFGLLGLLLVMRLIVVPWLSWQGGLADANRQLAGKLARAQHLLADQNAEERIEQLQLRVDALRSRLPEDKSDLEFQIMFNPMFEKSLAKFSLASSSRAWSFYDETPRMAEVRMNLNGSFYDFVRWVHELENWEYYLTLPEVLITPSNNRPGEVAVSLRLRLRQSLP